MNFVTRGSRDGKLDQQNIAVIYNISGTSETVGGTTYDTLNKMKSDYNDIGLDVYNFIITDLPTSQLYDNAAYDVNNPGCFTKPSTFPTDKLATNQSQREYTLMSKGLVSNKTSFINSLVVGLDTATTKAVTDYYESIFTLWSSLNQYGLQLVSNWRTSAAVKKYEKYTPFPLTQERLFTFTTDFGGSPAVKVNLQNIYTNKNDNADKNPFNQKRKFL